MYLLHEALFRDKKSEKAGIVIILKASFAKDDNGLKNAVKNTAQKRYLLFKKLVIYSFLYNLDLEGRVVYLHAIILFRAYLARAP